MGFEAQSSSQSSDSRVWEQQAPFLQSQYQLGQRLAGQQLGPVASTARDLAAELLPGARGALGTAQSVAMGEDPAGQFLQARLGADNPYLEGVINNLGADIGRQVDRDLAGTGAAAGFAGAGAVGGARHALERGLVQEAGIREFRQGAQDLRFADYGRQAAEAQALQAGQLRGAGATIPLGNQVSNLGMMPFNMAWMPLQQQAALLGRPTILSSGRGESSGFGFSL